MPLCGYPDQAVLLSLGKLAFSFSELEFWIISATPLTPTRGPIEISKRPFAEKMDLLRRELKPGAYSGRWIEPENWISFDTLLEVAKCRNDYFHGAIWLTQNEEGNARLVSLNIRFQEHRELTVEALDSLERRVRELSDRVRFLVNGVEP